MWRRLLVVLAVLGVALWCSAPPAQAGASVFRAALTTNPPTLDPYMSSSTVTRQIAIYLFETLVTFGENYELIPQLAESWDVSKDRLTYTFKLRKGVKFHNGKTLTAEDVKASFLRYKDSPHTGGRFKAVTSVDVLDEGTLRFVLGQNITFLVNLAMPIPFFGVTPKDIAEKYGKNEIRGADLVGTGPYKLLEWKSDVHVALGRFADYVPDARFKDATGFGGKRTAVMDEVRLMPAPEAASRMAGLETGEFDYAEALPVNAYDRLKANPAITPHVIKPKWAVLMELNHAEPPMNNVKFKQALVAALDMDEVMKAVTAGKKEFYRTQPSVFFPEQKVFYSEAGAQVYNKKDLAKVQRLLKEVGYSNQPIVYLANRDFDWMYKCALSVSQQWQAAGVNAKLEFYDWPSQIEKAKTLKGWHINQTGWSPRFDPSQLASSLRSGQIGAYNYKNPEMDKLLDAVNLGAPTEERQEVWNKIQQLIWDDVAVIRVGDYFELEATRANVKGYTPFYVTPRFWNVRKE